MEVVADMAVVSSKVIKAEAATTETEVAMATFVAMVAITTTNKDTKAREEMHPRGINKVVVTTTPECNKVMFLLTQRLLQHSIGG